MDGGRQPNRCFRFSPMDRLGRKICPSILDAAEEIGRRAIEHAENEFIDPAVAATLLEAAASVSRALQGKTHCTQNVVRGVPSYLFRAFIRPVNKTRRQQLIYEDAGRVRSIRSHNLTDARAVLELRILIDELLTTCDHCYVSSR